MTDKRNPSPFISGNPVFDAFVTLVSCRDFSFQDFEKVHTKLMDLAKKEPGGLKYPTNLNTFEDDAQ